jgi:Asp-tRNA(Asn)/Glu-tRNA(Gln) amidotransferase A subunit family amidase
MGAWSFIPFLIFNVVVFFRFDIEGFTTGFGNPDWLRTHDPASRTAPAVRALVQAGATCVAKTHMDEMAYRY